MEMTFLGYGAAHFLCFEAPIDGNGPLLVWGFSVVVIACKDFESDFCCSLNSRRKAANLKKNLSPHGAPVGIWGSQRGKWAFAITFKYIFVIPHT
jgi:hypothetical protein